MAQNKNDKLSKRIADGSIAKQKAWQFITELNSDEDRFQATAIIAGNRNYTYRQMFSAWEKYAEVFSALSITEESSSRVAFACISSPEAIFALYGLNMTGAVVYPVEMSEPFNLHSLSHYITSNKITDIVISDILLLPVNLRALLKKKEKLGLRNIILLHTNAAGPVHNPMTAFYNEANLFMLRKYPGVLFMEDLLARYEGSPIIYADYHKDSPSIILQTSGTTKGAHKAIPHSDYSFNSGALLFLQDASLFPMSKNAVWLHCIAGFDASYSTEDMIHMPFACGCAVVVNYGFGIAPEGLASLINTYKVNMLLINGFIMDGWMMSPHQIKLDMETVEYVALGGSYISSDKRKIYNRFLKDHGCKVQVINGYGMSEFCGACIFSPPEREDDSIGYPLPGIQIRIQDENDGKFYAPKKGPHRGEMYIASPSIALEKLDGKKWSERIKIDGETYLRTNDVVSSDKDGCLSYAGRSNRYFVDNSNIRFEAGKIETAVSSQEGIHDCAMIPKFNKVFHDTVPMLCVKTEHHGPEGLKDVHKALCKVFIDDDMRKISNLPSYCVITDDIIYNSNGKVDIYRMTKGDIKGAYFIVKPVYSGEKLTEIQLLPIPMQNDFDFIDIPQEIKQDYKDSFFDEFSENNENKLKQLLAQYRQYSEWFKQIPRFPF